MENHLPPEGDIELSVVIPVFNEEGSLEELYQRLHDTLEALGQTYEVLFIDDGSVDHSRRILARIAEQDEHVRAILLTRNFGQHPAVTAGFERARGAVVVTLDADLQNPPEDIPLLLQALDGDVQVAAGWRAERKDSWIRRLPSLLINGMIRRITGVHLRDYGCMMRAYRRSVVDKVNSIPEISRSIPTLVSWLGVSVVEVKIGHGRRQSGRSKYGLGKLLRTAWDIVAGFSIFPLQLMTLTGFVMFAGGMALGIYLFLRRIFIGDWLGLTSIMALIFIFFGVLVLCAGTLGEYVGRIFIEVKGRPAYIVDREIGLRPGRPQGSSKTRG